MRHTLIILTLTFLCFKSKGQLQNIDSLLTKIDNQQVVVMMQYVWYPKMFSPSGDTLIKIGKPVTDKLVPLLTDTARGIIAHFLLSYIWADTTKDKPKLASGVYPIDNNPDAFLGVQFADFTFFRNNYNRNFAKQADLDKNKKRWVVFLESGVFKKLQ